MTTTHFKDKSDKENDIESDPTDLDVKNIRKIYWLGIANGVFFRTAMALIGPATVLPLFLATLTDRNWLIGIGSMINIIGWFTPQIFGAKIISGRRYRLPFYKQMGVLRIVSMILIAMLTWTLGGEHRLLLLILFLVILAFYSVTGGLAGVAFLDIIGKSIPARSKQNIPGRGGFFGWRIFLGSFLSVSVGFLIINPALDNIVYPSNFALLFLLTAVFVGIGIIFFCFIDEKPSHLEQRPGVTNHFARSFSLLREDPIFRRYFIARHLQMLWSMGMPFYILFAMDRYDLKPFWVGAYIAARYSGEMLFNILWANLSNRGHNRAVLRGGALLTIIPPLIVFMQVWWNIPEVAYGLVFFVSGGAVTGSMLGGNNYLLQHASPEKRALYLGLMNSTLGITIMSTGLGGLVVDIAGFQTMFGIVGVLSLITIYTASRLRSPGTTR